ncbi:glycoside hydrolase family 3 C-terminal domain-containing protein [Dactylosporangium sp. NPDC051484]|uniref:glycoside hydrolase family 3 C-terminal domain-containing protein n=1 Tax=Dactylosporangium sp. NPDC051484 TaxID=3154942 RepID=UPI00344FBE7D
MTMATEAAGAGAGSAQDLTLAQKASLTSGGDAWHTQAIPAAGIAAVMVSDGPHGLRKQTATGEDALALSVSTPATCFPPAAGLASCWNTRLVEQVGRAIGREAAAEGVSVVLGPGVNIKRSPLGGRNFEYLSEDPLLAARLGAAFVRGLQSVGVGASVKHFAVNNQETDRMRVSADVDERTLREIYLPAFEYIVRTEQPATVMAAYNKINGVYCSEHHWLLTEVLRGEWGFEGLVVSDWGAVVDRVAALAAGLDLEMPPRTGGDVEVGTAVARGELPESTLDAAVARVLALAARQPADTAVDLDAQHELAHAAALESAVLLKNDDAILPLAADAPGTLAVIGEFARSPRYQGGGSSHVLATRVDDALSSIRAMVSDPGRVAFAPGFTLDGRPDPSLVAEATELAGRAGTVLVFLGLPEHAESEGLDRTDLDLPADQLALLDALTEVSSRLVVVLSNGSAVTVAPWQDGAAAILEGWLLGQAGGTALAQLLFGVANPSGKLAESLPVRLRDTPSYLHFPGGDGHVRYGEGIYVGYRYYDTLDLPVAYPFGHGLSYTSFAYDGLRCHLTGANSFQVTFTVTNTGPRAGAEIAQLYLRPIEPGIDRPVHELKAFAKVTLASGARETVTLTLDERDFAYWSPGRRRWTVDEGAVEIQIGASSRDIRLRTQVHLAGTFDRDELTANSTLGEWFGSVHGERLRAAITAAGFAGALGLNGADLPPMPAATPLSRLVSFLPGLTQQDVEQFIRAARDTGFRPDEPR